MSRMSQVGGYTLRVQHVGFQTCPKLSGMIWWDVFNDCVFILNSAYLRQRFLNLNCIGLHTCIVDDFHPVFDVFGLAIILKIVPRTLGNWWLHCSSSNCKGLEYTLMPITRSAVTVATFGRLIKTHLFPLVRFLAASYSFEICLFRGLEVLFQYTPR